MSVPLPACPFDVLIVAKTRLGPAGACIGGITQHGVSVRLVAADEATNPTFNQDYSVGDVWRIHACRRPSAIIAPHTEDLVVLSAEYVRQSGRMRGAIEQLMPPHAGGPETLYAAMLQRTEHGRLYIGADHVPDHSTCFWRTDRPLTFHTGADGKFRYAYPGDDEPLYFTYVGIDPPVAVIPAGSLVRVSMARWWQPPDQPTAPLRCYTQISGWIELGQEPVDGDDSAAPTGIPLHTTIAASPPPPIDVHHALRAYFGFDGFRPYQQEIIETALQGRDCLVVMSTGAGKSLCYQLPAVVQDGLTVVVSPLISLMDDQVLHLQQMGIPAAALHSNRPPGEAVHTVQQARAGRLKLLYMAPEALLTPERLYLLNECAVNRLVIDEAHCVSEWGHDFRPEYRRLAEVRAQFPDLPVMALTATATPRVREDILANLSLRDADIYVASFDRPNLFIAAQPRRDNGLAQIQDFLAAHRDQTGIIYCQTRNHVDLVATALQEANIVALPYHGGMDDRTRADHQRRFSRDEAQVMVATVAFGMGIDKPDIRFVLHYSMPLNLESYFQQIGRAGRDGDPADCLLLHAPNDIRTARLILSNGDADTLPARERLLQQMIDWVHTTACRRHALLAYFGDGVEGEECDNCDNCRAITAGDAPDDLTEYARLFLECVRATGQFLGASHIIKVLRGSGEAAIHNRHHDQLSCYGQGRHLSQSQWRQLSAEFHSQQLVDMTEFRGLRLTARGREVLASGRRVMGRVQVRPEAAMIAATPQHTALFERLRALRMQLAQELNVPAYVVFSDRSLREMAARRPRTDEVLLQIHRRRLS